MIIVFEKKATKEELKKVAKDLDGYIKFVVDIEEEILAAGGEMHVDAEKLLISGGSNQKDLWGGGLDLETKALDYNSMINIRPNQNNPSRDVMDNEIRTIIDKIVKKILL